MTTTAATATTTLCPRTWGAGEPWVEINVPIRYRKREHGLGYYVLRADTGQELGMVSKAAEGWRAYVLNGAYYPAGSEIMVTSEKHRNHGGESWATGELVETSSTRQYAADAIVGVLTQRRAESLEDLVATARAPFLATRPEAGR